MLFHKLALKKHDCTRLSIIRTLQRKRIHPKQTQPKRQQNTAHCRQSVKQTAKREEKIVKHTVPDKNRSGALSATRSTRWETKDKREVQQAMRDAAETGWTGNE